MILICAVFLVSGCRPDLSDNTNLVEGNTNSENVNAPTPEEEIEVEDFDDAEKAYQKGKELLDESKIEPAIDALKQAAELDPDMGDAHYQLAVALALKESEEDKRVPVGSEEEDGKKSKKEEKSDSEKSFENAVKAYKKQIAKDSKDHAAHFGLGRSYAKLYEDQKARKALERAVKLNGEDALYRTELGDVLIKLAQYPPAIKQLTKALELDEENYRAEDLLDEAKAGRKRVQFKKTPRPPKGAPSSGASSGGRKKAAKKPKDGAAAPPPPPKPAAKKTPVWPPKAPKNPGKKPNLN